MKLDTKLLTIAIDGASSSGKSSVAKMLAYELGYVYIDTGAMYRGVTLYFLDHNIALEDNQAVHDALDKINISLHPSSSGTIVMLNGRDVSSQIRGMRVSSLVSEAAALSNVRRKLVALQQNMGKTGGIVMDGRDIGTVVFPEADLKIFLHCDLDKRIDRRFSELIAKADEIDREEVAENLRHRDHIDSTRIDSPLRQAEDAIVLDNSQWTLEETMRHCLQLVKERL